MRTCKRCETEKPIDEFEKPTSRNCKVCKDEAREIKKKKNAECMRRNYKKKSVDRISVSGTMRTCKRCETEKPIDEFEKSKSRYCKVCKEEVRQIQNKKSVEYQRKKRDENPEEYRRKNNENVHRYQKQKREENPEEYRRKTNEYLCNWRKKKRKEDPEQFKRKNNVHARRYIERELQENPEEFRRKQNERSRNSIRISLRNTRNGAKLRGIPIEMSDEELLALMRLPCTYCGFLDPRGFGGIDRMNNDVCYTSSNTTPCCKRCNMMKVALDPVTFWERCASITHFRSQGALFSYYRDAWPQRSSNPQGLFYYQRRANVKDVSFSLTEETYKEIIAKPCSYCHRTGSSGLDRILPRGAYCLENVVPACVECNVMRKVLAVEEFYDHCQRVAEYVVSSSALEIFRGLNIPRTTKCMKRRAIRRGESVTTGS